MAKPKVLIFSGFGLNCEEETKYAFELAGAKGEIVHINDLVAGDKNLQQFQILALPGGFSYGDHTGSGNAYAQRIKNRLWEQIKRFVEKDHLVIGICNGFQILTNLGLVPALGKNYGKQEVALLHNDNARYTVRWVDVKVENKTPWLVGIESFSVPIAHGEGKVFVEPKILDALHKKNLIALRYYDGVICNYQGLQPNPNGSVDNIAGLTDETGRIFGLMPHPERAIAFTHLPNWTFLKEQLQRDGKDIPKHGPGLQIFKNSVTYFK